MFNPEKVSLEFSEKLVSRERHIVFLLGAGSSCAAGLPDISGLKDSVREQLDGEDIKNFDRLDENRNIEEILSRLRLISEVLSGNEDTVSGFTQERAEYLDKTICSKIASVIRDNDVTYRYHRWFATWVGQARYSKPIEIFTLNYDLLVERGLELSAVPYFDGFVGNYEGSFRADLVDVSESDEYVTPPPGWVRVWKLHGSITWTQVSDDAQSEIKRVSSIEKIDPKDTLAIYPSMEKYQESRRIPFVVLGDRFRRSLSIPETLCVVSGYSFSDDHINELLFNAARHNPSSEILVFCFSEIPTILLDRGKSIPNLTVLGPSKAIIGTIEGDWDEFKESTQFWDEGRFLLGDFGSLSSYLIQKPIKPTQSLQEEESNSA